MKCKWLFLMPIWGLWFLDHVAAKNMSERITRPSNTTQVYLFSELVKQGCCRVNPPEQCKQRWEHQDRTNLVGIPTSWPLWHDTIRRGTRQKAQTFRGLLLLNISKYTDSYVQATRNRTITFQWKEWVGGCSHPSVEETSHHCFAALAFL